MSHLTSRVHQAVLRKLTDQEIWDGYTMAHFNPWMGIVHDDMPEANGDVDLTCWTSDLPFEAEKIKNLCPKCKVILDAAMEGIDLTKVL